MGPLGCYSAPCGASRWLYPCSKLVVDHLCPAPPPSQIRFTRLGRKRTPFYRIIAIDSRKRRDGAPLEYLGWYDPVKKQSNLDAPAIKAWLGKGAQPSDTVRNLLKKSLIMD